MPQAIIGIGFEAGELRFDCVCPGLAPPKAVLTPLKAPRSPDCGAERARVARILTGARPGTAWLQDLEDWGRRAFRDFLPGEIRSLLARPGVTAIHWGIRSHRAAALPWELLHDGSDFLALRLPMGRILHFSGTITAGSHSRAGVLILADLAGDLAHARQEGERLQAGFLAGSLPMARADELYRRARLHACVDAETVEEELRRARIAHFCSHSINTGRDGTSGWLLKDGKVFDLERIRKLGAQGPVPAFIFSNSCSSADPDSETRRDTLTGMAGAFLAAGVSAYLGALCRLQDDGGGKFAEAFYRHLGPERPIAEAVLEARKAVGRREPAWAAYVFHGDVAFTLPTGTAQPAGIGEPAEAAPRRRAPRFKALVAAAVLALGSAAAIVFGKKASPPAPEPAYDPAAHILYLAPGDPPLPAPEKVTPRNARF